MEQEVLQKIVYSLCSIVAIFISAGLAKKAAKKTQEKNKIKKSRYFAIKRFITISSFLFLVVPLIYIWGIDIKNLWVSVTSIIAMIAVAFFAIWSLIGNMLAGLLLYFTTPFKINDTIELLPDDVGGKVLAINTFYTVLVDSEQNYISIPNSLFFQKYIKLVKRKQK